MKSTRMRHLSFAYPAITRSAALSACILAVSISVAHAEPADQIPAPLSGYGIVGDAAVAAYPSAALAARTPGLALVTCERDAAGKPHHCWITSETPAGQGFGAAALKLMRAAAPEGVMQPGQRQALPFRFLFRPDPPTITPDVFHPAQTTPYITHFPTKEESTRAVSGMPLSGPSTVEIDCWIGVRGLPTDCKLLSETPPGTGMGAFEIKMLSLDRFALFTREGFPTTGMKITSNISPTQVSAP
jgi:hypothetical protein